MKHNSGQFMYAYQYKDHLGNIRLSYADVNNDESIDSASEILEENNYYPFGLKHQGYNEIANNNRSEAAEKYKYNGKEFQDELNLNMYDFGLRQYDPALGRFLQIDPVTHHNQSPYVAFDNNPVVFVDPDGADSRDPIKESVTMITSTVDKSNVTHISQTTTNTTTTINDDGSVNVSYSTASITNTVDAYGNVTNGNTVTQTSGTITRDSEGNISSTTGKSTTRNAKEGDSSSALGKWTSTVSNYNKSNGDVYNKNLINKGGVLTTGSFAVGALPLTLKAGASVALPNAVGETLSALGLPSNVSLSGGLSISGGLLTYRIGEANQYAIMYDLRHTSNGGLIKDFKDSNSSRKSVGPKSFW